MESMYRGRQRTAIRENKHAEKKRERKEKEKNGEKKEKTRRNIDNAGGLIKRLAARERDAKTSAG